MSLGQSGTVGTIADLRALGGIEDGATVFVRGYYTIADGGGGQYAFDASSAESDNGGTVIAPTLGSGRWALIHDGVLTVEQFGAGGDQSATTNMRAFREAVSASPETLYFRNVRYSVFSSITDSEILFKLADKRGMTIDGRGAELSVDGAFGADQKVFMFLVKGSSNITIRNFTLTGPEEDSEFRMNRGMYGIWLRSGSENIVVQNIRQESGIAAVGCGRNPLTEPLSSTCKRILVENYKTVGVGYPLNFRDSGDDVKVRNFKISRCSRAYFPYGCRNHDVELTVSDPDTSPTINLAAQARTPESAFLENIRCSVTMTGGDGGIESEWAGLTLRTFSGQTHPVTVRNIRLNINGVMSGSGHRIFTIDKRLDGAPDTEERGHTIQDVELSGNVVYQVRGNVPPIQAMVSPGQGEWGPGERVRNLRFRNLHLTHPGVAAPRACQIGAGAVKDLLVFENCDIPKGIDFIGPPKKGVRYVNTMVGSSFCADVVHSIQSLDGTEDSSAISLDYLVTELRPVQQKTFRLFDGQEGQVKQVVMANDTDLAKVKPKKLKGYKQIKFKGIGDSVVLKFTNNEWTILSHLGCQLVPK